MNADALTRQIAAMAETIRDVYGPLRFTIVDERDFHSVGINAEVLGNFLGRAGQYLTSNFSDESGSIRATILLPNKT